MSEQSKTGIDKQRLLIGAAIFIGVIIVLLFASQSTSKPPQVSKEDQETASASAQPDEYKNLYKARAEYLISILNLYYVAEGEYPIDISYMVDTMKTYPEDFPSVKKDDFKQIKEASELPDFEYKVRGDDQAYKFTYTGVDGNTVTKKGDYQNDYK